MISQKPYKYAIIHTREEKQRFLYKCKLCCLWSDVKSHNADILAFVKVCGNDKMLKNVQKGTGVSAVWDILKFKWGRSKIEFHYVPEWGLPFKLLFKISFQIFDLNSLLLHRITVTYGYSPVFF